MSDSDNDDLLLYVPKKARRVDTKAAGGGVGTTLSSNTIGTSATLRALGAAVVNTGLTDADRGHNADEGGIIASSSASGAGDGTANATSAEGATASSSLLLDAEKFAKRDHLPSDWDAFSVYLAGGANANAIGSSVALAKLVAEEGAAWRGREAARANDGKKMIWER